MANEIQLSGQGSVNNLSGRRPFLSGNVILSLSSSLAFNGDYNQVFNTGSWVALNTASAVNKQYLILNNSSPSGSTILVSTTPNTGSLFSVIPAKSFSMLPSTASINYYLFANASSNGTGSAMLDIWITE